MGPRLQKNVTPQLKAHVRRLAAQKLARPAIAARAGVSESTVTRLLRAKRP